MAGRSRRVVRGGGVALHGGNGGVIRQPALLRHFSTGVLASAERVPVLVEFAEPPVVVYKAENPSAIPEEVAAYAGQLRNRHQQFLQELTNLGVQAEVSCCTAMVAQGDGTDPVTVQHDFVDLFNGVGLELPGSIIRELAYRAGVRTISLDRPRIYLNLAGSVPHVKAPPVWNRRDREGRPVRGQGTVIAVIDTGIDSSHPAFGGHQAVPNPKVIHAVAYTGEPPADNFGHGTHVAGICAGQSFRGTPRGDSRIIGVAPEAQLMNYKVLNAYGSGTAANIVLAIEDAVRRGAQVLNLSLGDAGGDPRSPEAVAANNAMRAGVAVCCAAGNAGPGAGTVGSPGAAELAITVGAATDPSVTALFARIDPAEEPARALEMRLMAGSVALPEPGLATEYADCRKGLREQDFPAGVRGRIALIERGEATFKEKARRAEAAGAMAVLIYNNEPGNFFGTLGEASEKDPHPSIPVLSLAMADGKYLLSLPAGAEEGVYRLPLLLDPQPVPQPDLLAEFSSRGPTRDGRQKPDLCAPGVDIESATITPEMAPVLPGVISMADPSGYTSTSGTSMATPHVAGACALLRQLYPDRDALTLKATLTGSARYMPEQGDANAQGAGMLDISRAVRTRHIVVTAGETPATAHHFGLVEHHGARVELVQTFRVQDLGAGNCPCRLRVRWLNRSRGIRASLSRQGFVLHTGESQEVALTLRVDGRRVQDGEYHGLLEASRGGLTMRIPFSVAVRAAARREPDRPGQPGPGDQGRGQERGQERGQPGREPIPGTVPFGRQLR